ncbi:heme lyase CcmF/NrfE family subunit [Gimibacter soli]|uniref:Heme lyase CcmF/NrfE family subunit n=1 Tax=Gimibacter soli TaxID=3024400 RepID=A0AAE9XSV8_9PROT|nr:heme lyase CcmF/NrfE family subunit [Gimibacter soli]WCL54460.1 heme lyase CcmF/NrfE family subunit [Gimibacter soli]
MIAEAGHFALVIATILALMAGIVPPVGLKRRDMSLIALADRFAVAQFLMVAIAFAALMHGFIVSDFSLKVVAANSHTAKPMLYKVAGTWGNHEGSLLLWVLILTLFASLISLFGRKLPLVFRARVLSVQALLSLGFLLFILVTSNPFERLSPAPLEGNGLNPLLQDPGLAFHPPMLYLGYVGLSVAFSFAVAALIEREVTPMWARWVRPWTLTAWIFLTGGIALGSWWAYYELGWGGWWFWDPVENASFMPWLAATALLHSAIVVEKRDALKSWTILLAIVAFSFSLLGTFLVRSGVITSVHAFAVDPARGIFILGFLAVVVGASLTLFAMRAPSLAPGGLFGLVSRESALVLNNILLATFAAVVLIGTLYPLFVEAAGGAQISVGAPFFDYAALVLMSPLIVALGLGPLLAWKRGRLSRAFRLLLPALIVAAVVFVGTIWATAGGYVMSAFGLALGLWLIASAKLEILQRVRFFEGPVAGLRRLVRLPRAALGMALAHMGLGVLVLAITISEAWTSETLTVLSPGETAMVGGFEFTLDKVEPVAGPNYAAVRGTLTVRKDGDLVTVLTPEDRTFGDPVMETTEAAIRPLVTGDLYAVIGEAIGPVVADGRWSLRLYFKPAISGLWLGALMMMAGGLLSLSDRRARVGAAAAREKTA